MEEQVPVTQADREATHKLVERLGMINLTGPRNQEEIAEHSARHRLVSTRPISNEEVRGLVYIPGVWRCAKCKFRLVQSNLNAHDGSVTARDDPGEKCPNDGSPLWRVTYKDDVAESYERWAEQVERAVAAEEQVQYLSAENDRKDALLREAREILAAHHPYHSLETYERAQSWLKSTEAEHG